MDFRQRHFARTLPFNSFNDVARLKPSFIGGSARYSGNYGCISEALRDRRADFTLGFSAMGFVFLVLCGA